MKRRLASKVFSGQDVCLFCAFRPAFNLVARSAKAQHGIRGYSSSSTFQTPANATAVRRQDENVDDEPPMLRQNQDHAGSFPAQRRSALPSSRIRSEQTTRESSNSLGIPDRRHNDRPQMNRVNGFRNNFDSFGPRNNVNRQKQYDERARFGQSSPNEDKNSSMQTESRNQNRPRFPTRDGFRPRQFAGQRSPYRDQPTVDRVREAGQDRSFEIRRVDLSGRSLPERRPSQRYQDTVQPTMSRRMDTTYTPFSEDPKPRWNGRDRASDRTAGSAASDGGAQGSSTAIDSIEAPAGMSFDTTETFDGFHHRRGIPDEKRKARSARFEDEDETIDEVSTTKSSSMRQGSKGRGGSLRATTFDYATAEAEEALYGDRDRRRKKNKGRRSQELEPSKPSLKIPEFMSVGQLANALGVQLEAFIQKLEEEGFEGARYDNILDAQTSSMFADLYGFDPIMAAEGLATDLTARPPPEDVSVLPPRPPIVTIMGHVDHGKTTILDYLRKSSVVATEHGGITQHIGAFSVTMPGTNRQITFLDTPGHAAFLEMRRRGANVTDIVVLVVAADDSVKPQTIEAIKHAKGANVQIIVAINKIDKEDANIDRVKQDLTRHEIVVEDYGGEYQAIPVSGKTGQGMSDLEEAIITLADVYDFRAEQDGPAEGTIIESKVTAAGRVATVLVRRGTLRTGDFIVAGNTWARVRTLRDDTGASVTEALPGTPVQVDGWRGEDPTAGLEVLQAENEELAKDVVELRIEQRESLRASVDMTAINEARNQEADARARVLAWESQQQWAKSSHGRRPKDNAGWVEPQVANGPKQVHFIVKADVAGSAEAVVAAVAAIGNKEISANVVHSGTGQVAESDIRMLATSGETGYVISFNQSIDGTMYRLAEEAGLQILDHNIIYKVTDAVKEKLAEQLPPIVTQRVLGEAEVGQIFEVTIKKNKTKIAGCKVTNGTISRANKIRVLRGGAEIYTGTLDSLKNVKKDVTEMRKGTECGMGFENWDEFQEGDQIQCFEEHEERRTLY